MVANIKANPREIVKLLTFLTNENLRWRTFYSLAKCAPKTVQAPLNLFAALLNHLLNLD